MIPRGSRSRRVGSVWVRPRPPSSHTPGRRDVALRTGTIRGARSRGARGSCRRPLRPPPLCSSSPCFSTACASRRGRMSWPIAWESRSISVPSCQPHQTRASVGSRSPSGPTSASISSSDKPGRSEFAIGARSAGQRSASCARAALSLQWPWGHGFESPLGALRRHGQDDGGGEDGHDSIHGGSGFSLDESACVSLWRKQLGVALPLAALPVVAPRAALERVDPPLHHRPERLHLWVGKAVGVVVVRVGPKYGGWRTVLDGAVAPDLPAAFCDWETSWAATNSPLGRLRPRRPAEGRAGTEQPPLPVGGTGVPGQAPAGRRAARSPRLHRATPHQIRASVGSRIPSGSVSVWISSDANPGRKCSNTGAPHFPHSPSSSSRTSSVSICGAIVESRRSLVTVADTCLRWDPKLRGEWDT